MTRWSRNKQFVIGRQRVDSINSSKKPTLHRNGRLSFGILA